MNVFIKIFYFFFFLRSTQARAYQQQENTFSKHFRFKIFHWLTKNVFFNVSKLHWNARLQQRVFSNHYPLKPRKNFFFFLQNTETQFFLFCYFVLTSSTFVVKCETTLAAYIVNVSNAAPHHSPSLLLCLSLWEKQVY